MLLTPYLNFNGQCEEAFNFYQRALGGKIEAMISHEGTPAAQHVPADWVKKIMHARLNIDGQVLMGADSPVNSYSKPKGFAVSIQVKEPKEADRIFSQLAQNGSVDMPIQQTFWAARFGMLRDKYGIPWMINCDQAQ
ncbi:MAG: VOC family protein [Candidatus Acidiferrales bacterium]